MPILFRENNLLFQRNEAREIEYFFFGEMRPEKSSTSFSEKSAQRNREVLFQRNRFREIERFFFREIDSEKSRGSFSEKSIQRNRKASTGSFSENLVTECQFYGPILEISLKTVIPIRLSARQR